MRVALVLVACAFPAIAQAAESPPLQAGAAIAAAGPRAAKADFARESPSPDARRMADWALAGDANGLPFVIVDKVSARVFAFDPGGRLRGAAPALLGLARGDVSPPGIGDKPLAQITPAERITPAGRFVASIGNNLGARDILWVDYASAISLHRVVTTKPAERRLERLASVSTADNRVSYGCINVSVAFYEEVVRPIFSSTSGIVYILPEGQPIDAVFKF